MANANTNKYIDLDYFLNTYNSQFRGSYTDETLQFYIDLAGTRINNAKTNLVWDYDTSEVWRQQLMKYANGILTEHWLKQGNDLTLSTLTGSVGSISFGIDPNKVEYIPKVVLDLLVRIGFRLSESVDASTEGIGPIGEYSPVFKTQQLLKDVSIEEGPDSDPENLFLLDKNQIIKLLQDASAGEFQFATGEYVNTISLLGDGGDFYLYKQSAVDGLLIPINTDIAKLFNEKANILDTYSRNEIEVSQASQNLIIGNNTQGINANSTRITEITDVIGEGGTTLMTFEVEQEIEVTATFTKLDASVKSDSTRPDILNWTQIGVEGEVGAYKTIDVYTNGRIVFPITIAVGKGNTTALTTGKFELRDEITDEFLDSDESKFKFENDGDSQTANGSLEYDIVDITETNPVRRFYVYAFTLELGQTLMILEGSKTVTQMFSSIGTGAINTSDDVINTSNQTGSNVTEALDSNKVTVDEHTGLITDLGNDKANKDETFTTVENYFESTEDNIGIRKRNINPTEEDANGIHSMELAVTKTGSGFTTRLLAFDSTGTDVKQVSNDPTDILQKQVIQDMIDALSSGFSRTLLGDYTNTSGTCAENPTFDLPIDWQDYKYFEIVYKGVISSNNDCSVPTTFQGVTTRMDRTVMDSGIYIRMVGNVSGPDGTAVEFLNNHQIRITAPSASFSKGEDGTIMKLFGVKY